MARPLKSQWEFGELFPAEEVRKVLTVSELTGSVRRTLESQFNKVWVTGEVSNLRIQPSGHVYFSIKDANAQLSCVLFRNEARAVNRDFLQDGQKLVLQGELTVYEARGQYQLRVLSVQLSGVGALQASFERLKQKLQAEGLFEQGHKRPLPPFPKRIGLVTSPNGAAVRDVIHGIERRNPALEIILAPCRVQGMGAAQEVAAAIHLLNEWSRVNPGGGLDLILVTRGGGSLEDLWAFNEEQLARAIYASDLPVISAVGHEIDFTISDFVADVRAATPTAAAEIITEGIFSRRPFIAGAPELLETILREALEARSAQLRVALRMLARGHPRKKLNEQSQRLDEFFNAISRCYRHHLRQKTARFETVAGRFLRARPDLVIQRRAEKLAGLTGRLHAEAQFQLRKQRDRLDAAQSRLRLLSPQNVLNRGYSITIEAQSGKVIRDPSQIPPGAEIISQVQRGKIRSVVKPGGD